MVECLPDWYAYFVAAEQLKVPPWVAAGIQTDESDLPICWTHWAWDLVASRADAKEHKKPQAMG